MMSRKALYTVSMLYLWFPLAIFLAGWTYWWVASVTVILGLWISVSPFRHLTGRIVTGKRTFEITVAVILLFWVIWAGIGGIMYQDPIDQVYRNAVFRDLVYNPWPVIAQGQMLNYYFGFWLPAVVIAKLTGSIIAGKLFLILYCTLGLWLGLRLIYECMHRAGLKALFVLLLFGGMDVAGVGIYSNFFPDLCYTIHHGFWGYSPAGFTMPNVTLLVYAFNQYIPSVIATLLVLARPCKGYGPAVLAMLMMTSPFAAVGLFPLVAWNLWREVSACHGLRARLLTVFTPVNIASVIIIIPVCVFYSINNSAGHIQWYPAGEGPVVIQRIKMIVHILLLILLQMGVWIPFIWKRVRHSMDFWLLFLTSCCAMFIQVGYSADFGTRVQLAMQTYLTLQIAISVENFRLFARPMRVAFVTVGLLCVSGTAWELVRRVYFTFQTPYAEWEANQMPNIFVMNRCTYNFTAPASDWHFGPNDVSSPWLDDFFERHPECNEYHDYLMEPMYDDQLYK